MLMSSCSGSPSISFTDGGFDDAVIGEGLSEALMVDEHIQQLDQYLKKFNEELRRERDLSVGSGVDILNPDTNVKSARGIVTSKGGRREKTCLAAAAEAAAATVDTPSVELDLPMDPNEPTYCLCNQVSFGEMVACDNPDCKIEWFHYGCVGLRDPTRGMWYCSDCVGMPMRRKGK